MKRLSEYLFLWTLGGALYYNFEVAFRGFSHWSMFLLGGLCFVLIGLLNELWSWNVLTQAGAGGLIATGAEFVTACVVNLCLGWGVWDYSDMPLNLWGQVCPQFMVAWFFLSAAAVWMENVLHWLAAWLKH